jgi:peptidyl-prolyl cis-trans isomerase A (cyclophilin A)
MRRGFLAGSLALIMASLTSCGKPESQTTPQKDELKPKPDPRLDTSPKPTVPKVPDTVRVRLETSRGEIILELNGKAAPISTANFLAYLEAGKLKDGTFWRAMRSEKGGFIQASASGHRFPPIAHEPTSQTGLTHKDGTLSMARYAVGTASNQFTISVGDMSYMDAGRDPKGDNQGYAAFGRVVSGMGVVRKILGGRIAKTKVEGGWDGQMLAEPIVIISAEQID